MPIKWDISHSVNVKEIDEQHQHFIRILNKLYESVSRGTEQKDLKVILDELVAYTDLHFQTEEKYFDKFHYENSTEHKAEHTKLRGQVGDFYKKFEEGKAEISVELLDFLEDWLVDHLDGQDKKYVECFNKNGLY